MRLFVAALSASLVCACGSAGLAAADRTDILRSLISTPAAKLAARAAETFAASPEETRGLALDLIFYRWASAAYELDPGIERLDQIAGSLASASSDPAIIWAAAVIGSKDWATGPLPPEANDETIKSLSEARQALRAALNYADTYPTRSIESLETCAAALAKLKLDLSNAFVTARLAERQLYATRRYRDAEANYERAHPVFSAYGLRAQVARIFDDLGRLNTQVGRYDDAHRSYGASAAEWQALARGDLAGQQFINAGSALAADGKPERALAAMLTGLDLSREYAYAKNGYAAHAQLLLQVASFCTESGRLADGQKLLTEAEDVAARAGDRLLVAAVLQDEATAWTKAGQEASARTCLTKRKTVLSDLAEQGAEAAAKLADRSLPSAEQSALLAAAETGASARAALGEYQQGLDVLKPVVAAYDALKRDDDEIRALRSLASYYEALKDPQNALLARRQAAELGMKIGKRALVVDILGDIERSALAAQDAGTALEALRESVQVIEGSGDMLALADALKSRGSLLASMGQTSDARRDLEKSVAIYEAEVDEPWSAAEARAKLAEVQEKAGKPGDAIASLSAAVQRIEDWAADEGVAPDSEPGRADTLLSLYRELVRLEIGQGRKAEALERLRNGGQYTWFGKLRSLLLASGDPATAEVFEELSKTAGDARMPPRTLPGGAQKIASGWQAVLGQVPQFSRLAREGRNPGCTGPIDAGEIYKVRDKLPAELALIEYAVSDSAAYALVVTKRSASCWQLPATGGRVDAAVQALRKAIGELEEKISAGVPVPPAKSWSDPALLSVLDPLFELEEMLFEPLRGDLSKITMLSIALPEELAGVPFHALPREKPGPLRFVVQDYAVSYLGAGMLGELANAGTGPVSAKRARVAIFAQSPILLPGAMREANLIRTYYRNSQIYTGSVATAERFVRAASSVNIVHIAAHHRPDPNPSKFNIVLSGQPGGPGTLRLSDLNRINNPNLQLAVLSACETMGSSDAGITGTAYTAEIFALAGFPTIIGGLWKVSDDASVRLMGAFYRSLASTGRKAEALRRAQVSMIESKGKEFAHPFYWASFALYGDPR